MSLNSKKFAHRHKNELEKKYNLEVTISQNGHHKLKVVNPLNQKSTSLKISCTPSDNNYKKSVVKRTIKKLKEIDVDANKDDFCISLCGPIFNN